MVNVHASGGRAMLEAARNAADQAARAPLLIAVTVLTSLSDDDLPSIGWARPAQEQAILLARLAAACGLDGVVSSPHEAAGIKRATRAGFLTVTPGIRAVEDDQGDQSRVMTPERARAAGADHLVIGRPITQAANPLARLTAIVAALNARA
jgi:orotidine-5'-phosphate decarboxylase